MSVKTVKSLDYYTYRCQYCGMECISRTTESGLSPTRRGDYGSNATPTPTSYVDEAYEATTISFVAETADEPAKIQDSLGRFSEKNITSGSNIRIETGSGTNDGDYTIADRGVNRKEILLSDDDSLTTESAATAGTVTISTLIYEPNVTTGCPLCGSLNSK